MAIKRKHIYTIVIICLAISFLVIAWMPVITMYVQEFFATRECRNVGGSYDYQTQMCDLVEVHLPTSFFHRYKGLFDQMNAISLAISLFAITLLLLKRKTKDRDDYIDKMEEVEE